MTFETPDQALRATVETFERCSSVKAMDPVAQEGTRFARECSKCGSKPFRVRMNREGVPFAFCRHCGKDRPREEVFLLRSSGGGRGDASARLCALADLENAVGRALKRDPNTFRAYSAVVVSGRPMWQILELCNARKWGPGTGGGFTRWSLGRAIRTGRAHLATELHRAGMLSSDISTWTADSARWGRRNA